MGNQRRDHLMTTPYIQRRYVTIEEEGNDTYPGVEPSRYWTATVFGPLVASGETITMSREGRTAESALENLRTALEEQGWELR